MLNDEGPNGKSYILALNEYCQHYFRSDVKYIYERCDPNYSATAVLDGLTYATECNINKRIAKIMAARATAQVLMADFRDDGFDKGAPDPFKLSLFDQIDLADDRIPEVTMPHEMIKPYRILLICLHRNFGYKEADIEFMTHGPTNHCSARLTMSVGSHSVSVPMSRFAKQEASQSILMNVHPHINTWGSMIRMYVINKARSFSEMIQLEPLQNAAHIAPDSSDFEDDIVPQDAAGEDKGEPRSAYLGEIDDSETDEDYEDDDDESGSDDSEEDNESNVEGGYGFDGPLAGDDFSASDVFSPHQSYYGQISFGDLPAIGDDIDSDFEEKLLDPLPICTAPIMTATTVTQKPLEEAEAPRYSPTPWRVMEGSLADEPDGWAPWPPTPPTVQPLLPPGLLTPVSLIPNPLNPNTFLLPKPNLEQTAPDPVLLANATAAEQEDPRTVLYRLLLGIHDLKIDFDEDDDDKGLPGNITPGIGSLHIN